MGAEYLFYMKSIETHARLFLALIILGIGTVFTHGIERETEHKLGTRTRSHLSQRTILEKNKQKLF